jgi:hypothetical protein
MNTTPYPSNALLMEKSTEEIILTRLPATLQEFLIAS